MYNGLSATALANFQNGDMQYVQLTIGTDILTNNRIIQGTFAINSYVITGESITFGSCVASELTFTLNNYDGAYDDDDFIGKEIYVEIGVAVGNSYEYVPFGYYIVDEATVNRTTVSIVALDRMTLFDVPVNSSALTFPCTTAQLLTAICSTCNVTLATTASSITNASLTLIGALPEQTKTYRDLLKWICEISGTNAYMNRNGSLVLAWFPSTSSITAPTLNESTRTQSSIDTTDFAITGVTIIADNAKTSAGTTVRPIIIQDNPLILPADYQTVVNNLNTKVNGFTYHPFTAVNLPTPVYDVMDVVVFSKDSVNYNVFITEITFKLNGNTALACGGDKQVKGRSYGLQDATLYAGNIAAGAITTDKLAAGAITADKISTTVDMATNAGVASTYATQADAIKREQKIYRRTTSTTAPATPTSWVTSTSEVNNAWTTKPIAYNATYKYLWVSIQRETVSGTRTCTTPVRDSTITVIDGANIITGSVDADRISVTDLSSFNATIGGWSISSDSIYKTVTIGAYEYMIAFNIVPNANEYSNAISVRRRPAGSSDQWTTLSGMLYGGYLYSVLADINGKITTKDFTANGKVRIVPDYDLQAVGEYALELIDADNGISSNFSPDFINVGEISGEITGTHIDGSTVQINNGTSVLSSDYASVYMMNLGQGSTGFLVTEGQAGQAGYVETFVKGESIQIRKIRATGEDFIELKGSRMFIMDYVASANATSYGRYTDAGVSFGTVSGNAITDYLNGYIPATYKTSIAQSQLKVNTHDLLKMMPSFAQMFATAITASANLNSVTYLACGQYYAATSTIAAGLTNCPVSTAFSMTVEAPNSATYDNESDTGEAYRIRKLTVLGGEEWVQYCYKTSTTWTYGTWMQVSIGVSEDTYDNTNMKAGNLIARRNGNVVTILSTGNATSVASGNWRTYVTIAAKYRPKEETPAIVTNAYGEIKTARIRTNGNVDLYTGTTISSASNFAFTATYIV